jgi:nucleoside-diphosphate-sugar epimerase
MSSGVQPSAFVTRAAGFIGTELIKILTNRGCQVFGLAESQAAAEAVRRAGAIPVIGDLRKPGRWQDESAGDWVFHLPPEPECGRRLTRTRAESIARELAQMDARLLDAVSAGATRRIVYVAHASCYGAGGTSPITEDESRRPFGWGRCFTPALERLEGYVIAGLPIVTAFPGWVYGDASWFRDRIVEPVMRGRRVVQFGKTGPLVSTIHVEDCARALVHLAEHGEPAGRYFLVNHEPVAMAQFAAAFARAADRPLRVWPMPAAAVRLVLGPVLGDEFSADAVFSNIRLRGIGFRFRYPTLDEGIRQVLGSLNH